MATKGWALTILYPLYLHRIQVKKSPVPCSGNLKVGSSHCLCQELIAALPTVTFQISVCLGWTLIPSWILKSHLLDSSLLYLRGLWCVTGCNWMGWEYDPKSTENIWINYIIFLCATDPCYKGNCCTILTYGRESILRFMTEGRLNHILDVLRSQQILSRTDYETITSFPTVTSRARALLDTCLSLGEKAAQAVVAILSASKCSPLARGVWTNTVNWMAFSTVCCSQMSPEMVTLCWHWFMCLCDLLPWTREPCRLPLSDFNQRRIGLRDQVTRSLHL